MNIKIPLLALGLAMLFMVFWEIHWRAQDYPTAPEDDKHLYAEQRAKIEKLSSDDVVLIGSSRVLFDFQLNEFEEVTGRRPVQLAAAGTTPVAVLQDIVTNSDFSGKLIVGVTVPLYFSPPTMDNEFYRRIQLWLDHYYDRTWADRWTHTVKKPLQNSFAFLCSTEEIFYNELDLRSRIESLYPDSRIPALYSPFPMFQYLDWERNITMWRADKDTAYANVIKKFWLSVIQVPPEALPPPEVMEEGRKGMIAMTKELVNAYEQRGGQVIFVRCPSTGVFREIEGMGFPREKYWDPLVETAGSPSYHFEDYSFMNQYELPEWSHLRTEDAKQFTLDLAEQMVKDGVL